MPGMRLAGLASKSRFIKARASIANHHRSVGYAFDNDLAGVVCHRKAYPACVEFGRATSGTAVTVVPNAWVARKTLRLITSRFFCTIANRDVIPVLSPKAGFMLRSQG
jgi:hypothetical protein